MASDVRIPLGDGTHLPAALSLPAGDGPHPGVVVVHEVFGLTDAMRAVADRLAGAGYAAVVPDLFAHGNRQLCVLRAMGEVQRGRPGTTVEDIDASRAWLAAHDAVDGARLAVVGFCMGGGFALLLAGTAPPGLRAASVNYGRVPRDRERLRRTCPVVASYGGRDLMFRGEAARLETALTDLGVAHDVRVYPRAGHSFMNPDIDRNPARLLMVPMRLGYGEEEAEDSWRRILAFFDEHVRGAPAPA